VKPRKNQFHAGRAAKHLHLAESQIRQSAQSLLKPTPMLSGKMLCFVLGLIALVVLVLSAAVILFSTKPH
jgi:hypothetical protein